MQREDSMELNFEVLDMQRAQRVDKKMELLFYFLCLLLELWSLKCQK